MKRRAPTDKVDVIEQCRQVRRSLEAQFASPDALFDFLVQLDADDQPHGSELAVASQRPAKPRSATKSKRKPKRTTAAPRAS